MKTLDQLIDELPEPRRADCRDSTKDLSEVEVRRLEELSERFASAGATDALSWALYETQSDRPQLAQFVFLRELCDLVGNVETLLDIGTEFEDCPSLFRAIVAKGGDEEDLARLLLAVAKGAIFQVVNLLDGEDPLVQEKAGVGWTLVETDSEGSSTGRELGPLHEWIYDDEFLGPFDD